jgi:hypothetical protein
MDQGISINFVQPHFSITNGTQLFGELFLGFFGVLAIIYAISVAHRRRQVWPIMVMISAPFILPQEALSDILGRCAYALGANHHTAVSILGRDLPVYIFVGYFAYFAPVIWLVERFERGITKATFAKIWLAMIAGVIVFEVLPLAVKWWVYYGNNQPLNFGGHTAPMWWWPADANALLAMAVAVYYAETRWFTRPWHQLLYIPLGLLSVAAGIHPEAIPMWITISNNDSETVTMLASVLSIAMSLGITWILAMMVVTDGSVRTPPPASSAVTASPNRREAELVRG